MTDFDPANHLMKVSGADYLAVKWRLVWLRNDHPNAVIETEMIEHTDTSAIFKATVDIPLEGGAGGGSATGWGSETKGDFKDFLEKAETKALGRALGALGYGTQFAPDLDDGSATGRVVDSPVQRDAPARQRNVSQNTIPEGVGATQTHAKVNETQDVELMSTGQYNVIVKHQKDLGWSIDDMKAIVAAHNKATIKEFTAQQARDLITIMADPAQADPYLAKMRTPATQAQMIDTSDASARARQ